MVNAQYGPQHQKWEAFCAAREGYLCVLAESVEQGFLRRDTTHPAFCGCVDWHSSVHGAYALLTASRLTGQTRWVEVVDASFKADGLEDELASLRRGDLNHELPYGFAWFLKLAREREQGWGKHDLLPLATEISLRLRHWLFSLTDEAVVHHAQRREYGNLSWALLNLWEWSRGRKDSELCEKLRNFTRTRVVPLDEAVSTSHDHITDEFFASSLQRTRTILSILPPDESHTWLTSFYRNECCLEPIHAPSTSHASGLNFSRAWGFWALFARTGHDVYLDRYVDHIVTHMHAPQYWRDDYRRHGHWVPQFGIYAIALSIEDGSI